MVCPDCEGLARRVAELEKLVLLLQAKNAELEKRLLAYENAHTPSSLSRRKREPREKTGNPPGAPQGHEGTTRPVPEPNKTVNVEPAERCSCCDEKLEKPTGFLERIITDLPDILPLLVTLFRLPVQVCKKCRTKNIATHSDLPTNGQFGYNSLALVAMLRHKGRLPCEKVADFLENVFHLKITPATVLELDTRTAKKLSGKYEQLKKSMRKARYSYTDETGAKVNGKRHNTWVFTNQDTTLLVTRKSRGKNVLEEILGKKYAGQIICDGHRAYSNFTNRLQRCWAHPLREVKYLAKDFLEAVPLHDELKNLYAWAVERYRKRLNKKQRYSLWVRARHRLRQTLEKYAREKKLEKFLQKMHNGFDHWFTFILHPELEPTNNRAERALRETVVQRKIFGCWRNKKGTGNHDILTSLIATWQQRGLNPYHQLLTSLKS
jgi:transposase